MSVSINGDNSLKWVSEIDAQKFYAELQKMNAQVGKISGEISSKAGGMDKAFANLGTTLGTAFTVAGLQQLGSEIVNTRAEFEQLEIAFTTMLGSKAKADALMKDLVKFASTTPFGLKDTASAAKQLLAYGSDAANITNELRTLGDVASGVGAPIGDLVYLYGTLRTQGKAMIVDIRQFAGRGIPIYKELAAVMGVNEKAINGLVSAGKVGFKEVEAAFAHMTAEGGTFGGLMDAQSQSIKGQFEKLGDALDAVFNKIGKDNEESIKGAIEVTAGLIENYEKVFEIVSELVALYGAYRAALLINSALVARQTMLNAGWSSSEIFLFNIMKLKEAAMTRLNAVMAASPVMAFTAAIAALGVAFYSLSQVVDGAELAQESLNKGRIEGNKAASAEQRKIDSLMATIKDHTATKEQQKDAYDNLVKATGGYLKGYSQEDVALGKAKAGLEEYITSLRKAAEARQALTDYNEIAGQLDDLNARGSESIDKFERLGQSLKNTFAPTSQGLSMKQWWNGLVDGGEASKTIVGQKKAQLEKAMGTLKKGHEESWKKLMETEKEVVEKEKGDGPGAVSKEIAKQRKSLLDELNKISTEQHLQNLTQDAREIESIRNKYKILREEAKKAGLGAGVLTRIDGLEKNEIGSTTYAQETEKLKKTLADKKELYSNYEEFATNVSKAEALKRYGALIGEKQTFSQVVDDEIKKLTDLQAAKAKSGGLTGNEQERLTMLLDLQKENNAKLKANEEKDYTAAFNAYKTQQEELTSIADKYAKQRIALGADADAEKLALLNEAERKEVDAVKAAAYEKTEAYRELNQNLVIYSKQQLKDRITTLKALLDSSGIDDALRAKIAAGIADAEKHVKRTGGRNAAALSQLTERKNDLQASIYDPNVPDAEKERYIAQLEGVNEEINAILSSRYTNISNDLAAAAGILGDLSEIAGGANTSMGQTLATMSQLATVGSDAAGSVASFMSGDIIGGITKGLKAITGVVKIFKEAKESARKAREEITSYYDKIAEGERGYAQKLRERQREQKSLNDLTKTEIALREQLLKTQTVSAKSDFDALLARIQGTGQQVTGMHTEKSGGFFGIGKKTTTVLDTAGLAGLTYEQLEKLFEEGKLTEDSKKLFEQLKKSKEELGSIAESEKALSDYINERMTGGLTGKNISDTIINGFKNGKRGVNDFADEIEEQVKTALLSALAYQALEEPIRKLMAQFTADAKDGLSQTEIDAFKANYGSIIKTGSAALTEIEKLTGESFSSLNKANTGISGAIQRTITEQTASEMSGIMRAQHELARRQLDATLFGTQHLQAIATNTLQTVERLDLALTELRSIVSNTKPAQNGRDLKLGI